MGPRDGTGEEVKAIDELVRGTRARAPDRIEDEIWGDALAKKALDKGSIDRAVPAFRRPRRPAVVLLHDAFDLSDQIAWIDRCAGYFEVYIFRIPRARITIINILTFF
jgi:hypothetical protein